MMNRDRPAVFHGWTDASRLILRRFERYSDLDVGVAAKFLIGSTRAVVAS
jgi:hypothetical protein